MEPQVKKTNNQICNQVTPYMMQGNRRRRNTNHYCWTHGVCAYQSSECKIPALGHKSDATFEDKKGGSVDFCTGKLWCGIDVCYFLNHKQLIKVIKKIYICNPIPSMKLQYHHQR